MNSKEFNEKNMELKSEQLELVAGGNGLYEIVCCSCGTVVASFDNIRDAIAFSGKCPNCGSYVGKGM